MPRPKFQTLTEQMFYILLCLRQERCGTEIVRYVDDATAGRVPLGPGTLYTILAKFQEEGLIREAAVEGTSTMIMSTLAGTLTTVVVYIPLAMAEGLVGMMSGPLSWTILLTMLSSFLCAVVVVPLAFVWLKPKAKEELPINGSWPGSVPSTAGACPACCAALAGWSRWAWPASWRPSCWPARWSLC